MGTDTCFSSRNYFARMSRFICQETIKSAEDNKDKKLLETQIAFAGELIAKMVRQGYACKDWGGGNIHCIQRNNTI